MLVRYGSFRQCLILLLLMCSTSQVALGGEAAPQKAVVSGTPTANLRAGAGIEHAIKLTLKESDAVTIDKLDGEWFLVTAADGQKGYIHKNLLRVVDIAPAQSVAPPPQNQELTPTPAPAVAPVVGSSQPSAPPAKTPVVEPITSGDANLKAGEAKAPSLLQILETHESEAKIGLLVAAIAFVIGWFCGGHYYIWREHKSRRRLRL